MKSALLNRIIYKESLWIFLSKAFVSLARVIGTIIFSYQLTIPLYGNYQNFWVQMSTLFAFSGLSLTSFVFSYSPQKIISIYRNLSRVSIFTGGVILICSGILFALLQRNSGINFGIAFLFLIFNSISLVADAVLTIFKQFKVLVWVNFGYLVSFVLIHLFTVFAVDYQVNLLVSLLVLITAGKTIFIFYRLRNMKILKEPAEAPENQRYKRFWLHLYFFEVIQILFKFSDKFVVSLFTPAAVSAIYQNATYTIPLVSIVFSAVSGAIFMQFSLAENNFKLQAEILKNSGKTFSLVALPLFFLLLFFSREFITLFFSAKYSEAIPIFQMSLWAIPLNVFNYTILLQRHEKGKIINQGLAIDIITTLLLIYPFYHFLGLKGIPLSFVFSTLFQSLFYLWHHHRILKLPYAAFLPLKDWIEKTFVFGVTCFLSHYVLVNYTTNSPILSLCICSFVLSMIILVYLNRELHLFKFYK